MSKLSIREAAERWMDQFEFIPASVFQKMARADEAMTYYDSDSLRLIASPLIECSYCGATYEGRLRLDQLQALGCSDRESCPSCDGNHGDQWIMGFPAYAFPCGWGTLFAPRERLDCEWTLKHADDVAELGLFVFESEDFGCLLGVDGAGFDFYDAYWVPLYRLRGLQWHQA